MGVHAYEFRPRKDKRGIDLISDVLPFGRLWYDTPDNAIGYAMHSSRSHDAVIRVYDAAGNVIETHEHKGDFKEPMNALAIVQPFTEHFPVWRQKWIGRAV
jgi:hypothetical protein